MTRCPVRQSHGLGNPMEPSTVLVEHNWWVRNPDETAIRRTTNTAAFVHDGD